MKNKKLAQELLEMGWSNEEIIYAVESPLTALYPVITGRSPLEEITSSLNTGSYPVPLGQPLVQSPFISLEKRNKKKNKKK